MVFAVHGIVPPLEVHTALTRYIIHIPYTVKTMRQLLHVHVEPVHIQVQVSHSVLAAGQTDDLTDECSSYTSCDACIAAAIACVWCPDPPVSIHMCI